MCGRVACMLDPTTVCQACNPVSPPKWVGTSTPFYPSANLMPSRAVPVLHLDDDGTEVVRPMKWGLVPYWHEGSGPHRMSTNNARLESLPTSKLYSRLLPAGRCVVLTQGFYEWRTTGSTKEPFYIYQGNGSELDGVKIVKKEENEGMETKADVKSESKIKAEPEISEPVDKNRNNATEPKKEPSESSDVKAELKKENDSASPAVSTVTQPPKAETVHRLLKMAGLYGIRQVEGEAPEYSVSVITMQSNETLNWLHERMPAVLETEEQVQAWLESPSLATLIPATHLLHHAVDSKVNSTRCHDEDCMEPAQKKPKKEAVFMQNWLKSAKKDGE